MKNVLIICICVLCSISTFAQDFKSLTFNLPSNTLVEMGVSEGAFLMSHSYQLCDTTTLQKFGRYGSDVFGYKSGLAIKVKGGYLLPNIVVTPWDFDENYTKYKGKYTPVSYQIKSKSFSDSTAVNINDGAMPTYQVLAGTDFCFVNDSTSFDGMGFSPSITEGEKSGWCIWYAADKEIENIDSLVTISTISVKYDLTVKSDKNTYEISEPKTDGKLIGGIFVVPTKSSIGCLTFELVGIISNTDSKWNIVTPFFEFKSGDELSPVTDDSSSSEEVSSDKKDEGKVEKKKKHSK